MKRQVMEEGKEGGREGDTIEEEEGDPCRGVSKVSQQKRSKRRKLPSHYASKFWNRGEKEVKGEGEDMRILPPKEKKRRRWKKRQKRKGNRFGGG